MNKKLFFLFSFFLLASCGPSIEEKQNIAIITCNIMSESRNMDAAMRIKEINTAREKINADPYLLGDKEIKESFKYGLCTNLVLNDSEYENTLLELKELERIAQEKAAEEARIKREEAKRLARIESEAREKREKLAREERAKEVKKNTQEWSRNFKRVLEYYSIDISLKKVRFEIDILRDEKLTFFLNTCRNLEGLHHDIVFVLKDNLGELRYNANSIGSCSTYGNSIIDGQPDKFTPSLINLFYDNKKRLNKKILESVYIEITGDYYWNNYKRNIHPADAETIEAMINKKTYNLSSYYPKPKLDPSIVRTKYQIYPSKD